MYGEGGGDVVFIDYEYSGWNPVGLDIANHFNAVPESCLIISNSFDVAKYYPTEEVRKHFLRNYFAARKHHLASDEKFIQACCRVIAEYSLAAELRWVIWAIVQAGHSPVDFDYLEYCYMRYWNGYIEYKDILQNWKSVL